MESLRPVLTAKESVEDELLKKPGVTGVAVGYKYVGGRKTDTIAVQVFVEEKRDVPRAERIPPMVNGVPTDVIQRKFELHPATRKVIDVVAMADTGTYNPVKGGISIGPCRAIGGFVFAGTLGAVVRDNASGNPLLLSNFHVMAVDTGWSVGDTMVQPSRVDTGSCPGGVVGTLLRAQLTASVDAAVCTLSGRGSACEIVDIGAIAGSTVATLGAAVRKRGRTTALTFGNVDSVSLSVNIDYGDGIGSRTLTNQIGITPDTTRNPKFGDHGDSGSVVVDGSRRVIGLYFAGSDDGYGVANPIAAVLSALNVSLCTPAKSIIKDLKDRKAEKFEKVEKREKVEKLEIKERKLEKLEIKERIKDHKPEKFEIEGKFRISDIDPKPPREGGDPFQPIDPGRPPISGPAGPGGLEERLSQLEAMVGQLTTFISGEQRPDLGGGALLHEPDVTQTSEQLEQDAITAMQAKVAADTAQR